MSDIISRSARRAAGFESTLDAPHAALLIDFDNVTMGIRSDLQNQLRKLLNSDIIKGKVSVQRAYADWRRYPQYIVPLSEASIDLIFAPAFGANKKNATDIRLAIDAMELVFARPEIGTFILLSGDSDFSTLVLKLKEYGKYVIGVGIRESSSDLLIQNCDEYFSYNELTGLAKEGEDSYVRQDPWELVVMAVQRMMKDGDVMRSDRLKQVMQSIDHEFSEKDAGFNRFSKFVVEAGQRGLLAVKKLDNGQYSVELGTNANVLPETEVDISDNDKEAKSKGTKSKRRRSTRKGEEVSGLTLSESFDLLRQALLSVQAVGGNSSTSERVREEMIALHDGKSDAVFEARRFPRLLRQAHDAGIIELIKSDADDYLLKLSSTVEVDEVAGADQVANTAQSATVKRAKRSTKRKTTTTRKKRSPARTRTRSTASPSTAEKGNAESSSAENTAAPVTKEDRTASETSAGRSL
ncbi:MAG: NYN domain-containing protein [Gemmatimonadales bacterium]